MSELCGIGASCSSTTDMIKIMSVQLSCKTNITARAIQSLRHSRGRSIVGRTFCNFGASKFGGSQFVIFFFREMFGCAFNSLENTTHQTEHFAILEPRNLEALNSLNVWSGIECRGKYPDQTFYNLGASKSWDNRAVNSAETLIGGLRGSQFVKFLGRALGIIVEYRPLVGSLSEKKVESIPRWTRALVRWAHGRRGWGMGSNGNKEEEAWLAY